MRIIILIAAALFITMAPLRADLIMTVNAPMGSNAGAVGGGPQQDVSSSFVFNIPNNDDELHTTATSFGTGLASSNMDATWDGSTLTASGSSFASGSGSLAYSSMDLNFTFDESYDASFTFSNSGGLDTVHFFLRSVPGNVTVYNGNITPTSTVTVVAGTYRLYLEYKAYDPSGPSGSVTASANFTPTVVPEPSTYALFLGGLAMVVALRRRVSARA